MTTLRERAEAVHIAIADWETVENTELTEWRHDKLVELTEVVLDLAYAVEALEATA